MAVVLAAAALASTAQAKTSSFVVYTCTGASNHDSDLCRVDADGRNRKRLTNAAAGAAPDFLEPTLTADGRRLAYVREGDGVFLAASDASSPRRLASGPVVRAAVSPAGDRVAFVEMTESTSDPVLFTVDADGGNRREVGRPLDYPVWLGDELAAVPAYANGAFGGPRVCVLDEAAGTCRRTIAEQAGLQLGYPDISRDGKAMLAMGLDAEAQTGIYSFGTTTGRRLRTLEPSHASGSFPTWAPSRHAYALVQLNNEVYLRQARLGGLGYEITRERGTVGSPVWGGRMGDRDPKLRITSVTASRKGLTVRGTISPKVRASVRANGESFPVGQAHGRTLWRKPRNGRFRFDFRFPTTCLAFVGYPGDEVHRLAIARRQARGPYCT
jgi:hypothetical protein